MVMAMADVWRGGSGTVYGGDIATTGVVICGAKVGGRGVTTRLARSKLALWWGSCVHVGNVAMDRRGGKAKSLRHGGWRGWRGAVVLSCMWQGGGEDLRACRQLPLRDECGEEWRRRALGLRKGGGGLHSRRSPQTSEVWASSLRTAGVVVDP
ncbi:hypothetical protein H4582DRAFT_2123851 [Lactarius indigo]|nr:hypothetical protein H4582DRAFT_2123851 [Lactarius indigo]